MGNLVGGGRNLRADDVEHSARIKNSGGRIQQGFNHGLTQMDTDKKFQSVFIRVHPWLKFVLPFGVEKLEGAVVIGFWDEDLGGAAQIAVVRQRGVHEILRGGDAVFFQHHDEHLGVDDRAGVKQFHAGKINHRCTQINTDYGIARRLVARPVW